MRPSTIIAPIFLAAVNAQQPSPTDAIQSAGAIISLGNSAISSALSVIGTNTNYAQYSSLLSQFTEVVWASVTSELGAATSAAANNPSASSALASYLSEFQPEFSSLTAAIGAPIPTEAFTSVTGSAASSQISSLASGLSSATSRLSSATSRASSASAAATSSTSNVGVSVQAGALGAMGAAVLGFAAFL